ncbi:MAG TPA: hypothetical protein VGA48_09575, partial [Thermoplasmata archaeon]
PIRELEGSTGLVFTEPRDPSGLAGAIQGIFEEGTLNGIQRRNQEWIRATPDWAAVARTFVSLSGS